jgi:hypothetical protein
MLTNFELVTEVQYLVRKDFGLVDPTLLNPNNPACIYDGEYLTYGANRLLTRAADGQLAWVCFMEKGRYDVQAIRKTTVLYHGTYEADTRIYDSAGLALLAPLAVKTGIVLPGETQARSGLGVATGAPGEVVLGYVTGMPAGTGLPLRFMQVRV